jgi:hypothetical protein
MLLVKDVWWIYSAALIAAHSEHDGASYCLPMDITWISVGRDDLTISQLLKLIQIQSKVVIFFYMFITNHPWLQCMIYILHHHFVM